MNPKINDGITIYLYSDRIAGTIHYVSPSGKTFWFSIDKVTKWDQHGKGLEYETQNPTPTKEKCKRATLTKNGWITPGNTTKTHNRVHIGSRNAYNDPSF